MKKLGIGLIIVFLGVSCVQNKAEAQSNNDAQRIIGTWKTIIGSDSDGTRTVTYTFNANGSYVYTLNDTGYQRKENYSNNGNYFVNSSRIIFTTDNSDANVYEFYLSSDGKILFLSSGINNASGRWYNKQ
ncbi:hypothetical protein R84B8_01204 [Treponema sp. R8-4-B8]